MTTSKLTGGKKLEAALAELSKKTDKAALLSVGFPEGSTESDGSPTPLVAFVNEFGRTVRSTVGDYYQMPRPFFRNMIAAGKKHWGEDLGALLVANEHDAAKSLALLGAEMEGELVESINQLTTPPLAQSTIDAKESDKPLIDKGDMWRGVTSQVDET